MCLTYGVHFFVGTLSRFAAWLNSGVRHMKSDSISEVSIDATGRLCVTPSLMKFPLVYRAALEVYWDEQGGFLHSPTPRHWSYLQWFQQIIDAARDEYGCSLFLTPRTRWSGVDSSVQDAILAGSGTAGA